MTEQDAEQCLLLRIKALRWKDGVRCPRCGSARCGVHANRGAAGRRKLRCSQCMRVFNDLTGTPFARSHIPLSAWFIAGRLMLSGKPTCAELSRKLKIKLSTVWRMRKMLGRVIIDPEFRRILEEES